MAMFIKQMFNMKIKIKSTAKFMEQPRFFSTALQSKIIEGTNGERIITTSNELFSYPEVSVPEYVWNHLQTYSPMIALECGVSGRKYTYAQARDYSNYVARSLLDIGLKPGDVVAMILPNLPESVIAILGCLEAGILVTMVNPIYTMDEISKQLISSNTKAVITCADRNISSNAINAVNKSMLGAKVIVVNDYTHSTPNGVIPFKDLITKGKTLPHLPARQFSPDEVAVLPFSSGTTGLPKGVMLTHRNLVANMEMVGSSVGEEGIMRADGSFQEVVPIVLPIYHIYGICTATLLSLSFGGKLITLPNFTPDSYVKILANNKVTKLLLAPPIVMYMSSSNIAKPEYLQSVKHIICGAAPLSKNDVDKFYDKFQLDSDRVLFCQGYGLTELSPSALLEKSGKKFSSVGKPLYGCDARLVDPVTKEDVHSPRQTGEVWIRGPHVMKGYLNNKEATRETLVDGWLLTGDIAYYDEDHDFYITDRLKELIKVKGFQVAPAELETLIRTHPNVQEAGVIGIPHDKHGEVPKAFVVLKNKNETTRDEIQNFVKSKVSEFKHLQGGVEFIESLPKNLSGKILRAKLKEEYCK